MYVLYMTDQIVNSRIPPRTDLTLIVKTERADAECEAAAGVIQRKEVPSDSQGGVVRYCGSESFLLPAFTYLEASEAPEREGRC